MKLAIIVALAPDRRSGRVLGDVVPADQAITALKAAIAANQAPDPLHPNVGVFTLDSCLRQHRFRPTPDQIAEAGSLVPPADELTAVLAANEAMQAQLADAKQGLEAHEAQRAELNAAKEYAEASAARLAADAQEMEVQRQALKDEVAAAVARIAELEAELEKARAGKGKK